MLWKTLWKSGAKWVKTQLYCGKVLLTFRSGFLHHSYPLVFNCFTRFSTGFSTALAKIQGGKRWVFHSKTLAYNYYRGLIYELGRNSIKEE